MNKVRVNPDLDEVELLKRSIMNLSRSEEFGGLLVNNPG